jgi:hypothetical protein
MGPAMPMLSPASTVAQLRVEKYADPWFFPDEEYMQQDKRRLHGPIGYFDIADSKDMQAALRLCDIIVSRFKTIIGADLHSIGSCRAFDIIENIRTEKGRIYIKFLGFGETTYVTPLLCLDWDIGLWRRMWKLLKEYMHRRMMVFLAMHARVGKDSSIYRATQHVLYERFVWTAVFKMM